jgi:hypothetical protein
LLTLSKSFEAVGRLCLGYCAAELCWRLCVKAAVWVLHREICKTLPEHDRLPCGATTLWLSVRSC